VKFANGGVGVASNGPGRITVLAVQAGAVVMNEDLNRSNYKRHSFPYTERSLVVYAGTAGFRTRQDKVSLCRVREDECFGWDFRGTQYSRYCNAILPL
jgi:hypothetical protein